MSLLADTAAPSTTGHKSVQDYIDELPVWSDGTNPQILADDRHAVAHLVARRRGKIL